MGYFYASGMAFAVLGGLVLLSDLWRLLTGQMRDDQLVLMQESEEAPHGDGKATH
jgi:TRAP-type transport system small permease protein